MSDGNKELTHTKTPPQSVPQFHPSWVWCCVTQELWMSDHEKPAEGFVRVGSDEIHSRDKSILASGGFFLHFLSDGRVGGWSGSGVDLI